jgi:hypothetical protein
MVATAEAEDTHLEEDEPPEQGPPTEEAEDAPEKKPRRRPRVSDDTPRERRELDRGDACPDCGGDLRVMPEACLRHDGEDVSELRDMIAAPSGQARRAMANPIRVLDRSGKKKDLGKAVKQGHIWAYVRDQRPSHQRCASGAMVRCRAAWRGLILLCEPKGLASAQPSRERGRHSAGRCLCRLQGPL